MAPRIRKTKLASNADSSTSTPSSAAAASVAAGTSSTTAAPAASAASNAPFVYQALPPADAKIPSPPSSFVPGDSADYRAVLPRDAELRALPNALNDLLKFTNYSQVLGDTAPSYAQIVQALTAAGAWSSMRTESAAWDAFCGSQEGIAWTTLRVQMVRLQPSFELASGGPTNVKTMFAGLAALLGAKTVIAKKGASTRKMNKQATAKGEAPTHGRVGKARKRKAEKAAYAAAQGAGAAPAGAGTPAVTAQAQPTAANPSPAAAAPTAPASPAPASANGVTNGAPHS